MQFRVSMIKLGDENKKNIYLFILRYYKENGYVPTIVEIMKGTEISSGTTVRKHMKEMFDDNLLATNHEGQSRAYRIVRKK